MQGSGKGTQAQIISKKLGLFHISTGDLLRSAEGELRKEIDAYIKFGNLVPDELILKILKKRILEHDCKKGFILDGFPRNLKQAEELDKIAKIDKIVEIKISDEEAIKRMNGRWNCKKCSIAYNYITEPKPKVAGKCDKCGSILAQREDDVNKKAIKQRLKTYYEETAPILEHYNHIKIDGNQAIEKVTEDLLKVLG